MRDKHISFVKVGDPVRCIMGFHKYLVVDNIYYVEKIYRDGDLLPTGRISGDAYSLYGVVNTTPDSGVAFAWDTSRFVPVNPLRGNM